jgi:hypothetical protein
VIDNHTPCHFSRTAALAAVLLTVVTLFTPGQAGAASVDKAATAKTGSVASGTWAATASTTSMTFTTAADQTSTVTNTGTIALVGISYKITVSNPASGTPAFTVFVCTVAWSANKCSGGTGTQVGSTYSKNSTTTVTSTVVPPVAGSVYLQVEPASVTSSVIVTLGTSITPTTQLRARVVTNQ